MRPLPGTGNYLPASAPEALELDVRIFISLLTLHCFVVKVASESVPLDVSVACRTFSRTMARLMRPPAWDDPDAAEFYDDSLTRGSDPATLSKFAGHRTFDQNLGVWLDDATGVLLPSSSGPNAATGTSAIFEQAALASAGYYRLVPSRETASHAGAGGGGAGTTAGPATGATKGSDLTAQPPVATSTVAPAPVLAPALRRPKMTLFKAPSAAS